MYSPRRVLSTFANGMSANFLFIFSLIISSLSSFLGSISHRKSYLPHIKKLSVLLVLLLFVLVEEEVEKVHIVHHVEIVMDIVRKMKVHLENIGHNLLVWVGVLLGSKRGIFFVGCAKFFFFCLPLFCHDTMWRRLSLYQRIYLAARGNMLFRASIHPFSVFRPPLPSNNVAQ